MIARPAARTTRASARAWYLGACEELPAWRQHMRGQASDRKAWWHLLSARGERVFARAMKRSNGSDPAVRARRLEKVDDVPDKFSNLTGVPSISAYGRLLSIVLDGNCNRLSWHLLSRAGQTDKHFHLDSLERKITN